MWTKILAYTLGITLFASTQTPAVAHSLKFLENQIGNREKYFQAIDKETPDFELQDPDGRNFHFADFKDKVVVLHFIYTNCPDFCPLHAERIAEIQEMVNQTPMKDQVQFISVTTDPKNDTAEVMRDYGPAHGLDPSNWLFLTTTPEQPDDTTRKLAEQFGHKFTKTVESYQVHGIVTHVMGRDGRRRANFHGLKFDPTSLVVYVNALVNDALEAHGHDDRSFWDEVRALF